MLPLLEVPVFSPASAARAASLGAGRIELNRAGSYAAGGLTPALTDLEPLQDADVPVRIMIRPRGAPPPPSSYSSPPQSQQQPPTDARVLDFVYDADELAEMRASIVAFKESELLDAARGDGFVFGVLRLEAAAPDGDEQRRQQQQQQQYSPPPPPPPSSSAAAVVVNVDQNRELVELARPFKCVFHRAFDEVVAKRPAGSGGDDDDDGMVMTTARERGLDALVECGFDAVLTSGGPGNAPDNAAALGRIVEGARRRGIEIVVGGGVRSGNVAALALALPGPLRGFSLHSSCLSLGRAGDEIDELELGEMLEQLCSLGNRAGTLD